MPKPRIYGAKARAAKKANPKWSVPWAPPPGGWAQAEDKPEPNLVLSEVLGLLRDLDRGEAARYAALTLSVGAVRARQDQIAIDIETIQHDITQIQRYVGVLATQALAIDDAAKRARADQYRRSIPTLLANAEFDMDT